MARYELTTLAPNPTWIMDHHALLTGNASRSDQSSTLDDLASLFDISADALSRMPREEVAPCTTYAPARYEPKYAYPLLVWLHGPDSDERELPQVMRYVSDQNFVAVAPRGTCAVRGDRRSYNWSQTHEQIAVAESRIFSAISVARRRFYVNAQRIFLAGYASGGTMAVRIAWNNPSSFAGVATIGGALPTGARPLSRLGELRSLPCLLTTARQSETYPERHAWRDLRLLHAVGCKVEVQYHACGDELNTETFAHLNRWMMAQICGAPC